MVLGQTGGQKSDGLCVEIPFYLYRMRYGIGRVIDANQRVWPGPRFNGGYMKPRSFPYSLDGRIKDGVGLVDLDLHMFIYRTCSLFMNIAYL